jgi:hypothetical protein
MPDGRLSTGLSGRDARARDGGMKGLLAALWSFLHHPATTFGDHLTTLEERLRVLETRLVGDFATAIDTGVAAVEETVTGTQHRLENDLKSALRDRVAGIEARLAAIKTRVVEDLKHELRRAAMILALVLGGGVLALVGTVFGLMALWTDLTRSVGSVGASLALAIAFLLGSLSVFALLRAFLHRSRKPLKASGASA